MVLLRNVTAVIVALGLAIQPAMAAVGTQVDPQQQTRPDPDTPNDPGTPDVPDTPDTPTTPDEGGRTPGGIERPDTLTGKPGRGVDPRITKDIVSKLGAVQNECGKYDPVYRIDCLRQGIELTLASLPKTGEYAEARKILKKAAGDLKKIVLANADPSGIAVVSPPGINKHFPKQRRYRAVRKERLKVALKQATAVIAEAQTQLLRSSENSERRSAAYQQIAAAVGSTKVLLRSA